MNMLMKVLLLNGSPHPKADTYTALCEVGKALNQNGIETEMIHVSGTTTGCMGCWRCSETGKCVLGDGVNEMVDKMNEADGLVIGSPVYFASPAGSLISFLDRVFTRSEGFAGKPCGVVAVARRAGTSATLDALLKYPMIAEMPVVSSQYWPNIHGSTPDQLRRDLEGMRIMRRLGENMAWMIKCIALGKEHGIVMLPHEEGDCRTDFIMDE